MIYDEFQKKAISVIEKNKSVIVCAPTGAGKTAIAEYVIEKAIAQKQSVIYTAPIKALSNQKFRDFTHAYPGQIGILTGDVSLNPQAPVLIMTTEIFRNSIFEDKNRLNNVSWVIFDEVHYLDDWERGTVWEESLIFCPPHIKILCLSATIPNLKEIESWLNRIHRYPIETVLEKKRPVPLEHRFQYENRFFYNIEQLKKNIRLSSKHRHRRYRIPDKNQPANKISSLLTHLEKNNELPAIYFCFSRKRCETLASQAKEFNFLNNEERFKLTTQFKTLLEKFRLADEPSAKKLSAFIEKGIAYHHAGLLPSLKEIIEQLFTGHLIKLIFTTETFALGINMPARTVVFDELRKFYGYCFADLSSRDYYQMAGRAGRRGIDKAGFVYSRINPHTIEIDRLNKIIFGYPEPILSQFNLSYASLLHLYNHWKERLFEIYPLTLHYFQSAKKARHHALCLINAKISLLKELGYIRDNRLTQKGEFASRLYGYELPITELFAEGRLESLSSTQLCVILAALVFEPRKHQMHFRLNAETLKIQKITLPVINSILETEKKFRISPLSKTPYFNLAPAMEIWAAGVQFSQLNTYTQIDAGEIVRYMRMVTQILRQLRGIALINASFKYKIAEAISKINRDEVDAEKQLREGF